MKRNRAEEIVEAGDMLEDLDEILETLDHLRVLSEVIDHYATELMDPLCEDTAPCPVEYGCTIRSLARLSRQLIARTRMEADDLIASGTRSIEEALRSE